MGRNKLPTSVKRAKGTAQNCRILVDEYTPKSLDKLPPPPDYLNDFSKKEYEQVGSQLFADGLIVNIDMSMFIAYCVEMGTFKECSQIITNEGMIIEAGKDNYKMPHPAISTKNTALKNALAIGSKFGITPSERTKVSAPLKEIVNPVMSLVKLNATNKKTA